MTHSSLPLTSPSIADLLPDFDADIDHASLNGIDPDVNLITFSQSKYFNRLLTHDPHVGLSVLSHNIRVLDLFLDSLATITNTLATEKNTTYIIYSHVERIYKELEQLGIKDNDPLDVHQVSQFDQYHYHGTESVAEATKKLGIETPPKTILSSSSHRVLDIGAGLGGPSRYLAELTGCKVTAIEMQEDLHLVATDLTRRCGLSQKVTHICGDILKYDIGEAGKYDFIVSWLVFLHIPEKKRLFEKCFGYLKASGQMYVEDFWKKSEFLPEEKEILSERVYMRDPPPSDLDYIAQIKEAGFDRVEFDDVTDSWSDFCKQRAESYRKLKERHVRVHGKDVYEEQDAFFDAMDFLFHQGHLGGCKLIATK
ncbi:hypothetical protein CAPTEDRAFT_224919 [Capitella teleta]|uniref:phosphoethanolamine N-methyltransferase n=1 Tax=Capitella teleta TaxID=283909 RepID=R7VAP9_CAPTE|nr:hypothetical protein CAPTEDRAFT_224919 [Capitella teleta]|eukprot:ELU15923.1 hypothetical protein CAPTEDRAFT_224919 [Capitella teleta]